MHKNKTSELKISNFCCHANGGKVTEIPAGGPRSTNIIHGRAAQQYRHNHIICQDRTLTVGVKLF